MIKTAMKKILMRSAAIPNSLRILLTGQLRFMGDYYDVVALTSGGENYEKLLEEQQIRGYAVPFTRKAFSPVSDISALIKLIRVFKKEKPFIVHSHTTKDGMLCMLAAWLCGVPNRIYTLCGSLLDMKGARGVAARCGERLTLTCANKVFVISKRMMDQYIAVGFLNPKKAKVILNGSSNGFDADYFCPQAVPIDKVQAAREECGQKKGQFYFCTVGRMVHDKGINELVVAFKRLQQGYPEVQLLLVGGMEKDLDPLKPQTIKEMNENPGIHFVGWKDDIRPYVLISDALIHPSHREGFGNVIAQACLLGKPCIVTDICGPSEIIIEGRNGTIYPPKDENGLYEKMKFFIEHREEVAVMGGNARESITSRYNRQKIWEALLEEYKKLEKE